MPVSAVTSIATWKKPPTGCVVLFNGSFIDAVLIAMVTLEFEAVQVCP